VSTWPPLLRTGGVESARKSRWGLDLGGAGEGARTLDIQLGKLARGSRRRGTGCPFRGQDVLPCPPGHLRRGTGCPFMSFCSPRYRGASGESGSTKRSAIAWLPRPISGDTGVPAPDGPRRRSRILQVHDPPHSARQRATRQATAGNVQNVGRLECRIERDSRKLGSWWSRTTF